jgi:hypothetical protein
VIRPPPSSAGIGREDLGGRGPQRLLEQLGVEARRWRVQLVLAVLGHRPVEPHQYVQMDQPTLLELADLGVGRADLQIQSLLRHPGVPRERAPDVDRRAPPQLAQRVVPDHRRAVVEALHAQGIAQACVALVVLGHAGQGPPVRADRRVPTWAAASRLAVRPQRTRVHSTKARCRERRKDRGVIGGGVGDALAAA